MRKRMAVFKHGEQSEAAIMIGASGLVLGQLVPTPGDAFHFWAEHKLNNMLAAGQLTTRRYWILKVLNYYIPNAAWWVLVSYVAIKKGTDFTDTVKTGLALAGAGSVVGMFLYLAQQEE